MGKVRWLVIERIRRKRKKDTFRFQVAIPPELIQPGDEAKVVGVTEICEYGGFDAQMTTMPADTEG